MTAYENIERKANKLQNDTIAKLTNKEANLLVANMGVGLYQGDLKSRVKGFRRTSEDGVVFSFDSDESEIRYDFIALKDDGEECRQWALRMWNKEHGMYDIDTRVYIVGCSFIR